LNSAEREQAQGRMPLMWQSGNVAKWQFPDVTFADFFLLIGEISKRLCNFVPKE
jgi:hypothetical protein